MEFFQSGKSILTGSLYWLSILPGMCGVGGAGVDLRQWILSGFGSGG